MAHPTTTSLSTPPQADWQPLDWYAAPLYYDILFQEETQQEAHWLHELFTLFGPLLNPSEPYPIVLEPACGSGRLLRALRGYGYRCIGFDRQSAAVEFARAQCEKTTADALSAPPPTCCVFQGELTSFASTHTHLVPPASVHMAHCLVSSLKYLPSDAALLQHFAGVATSLVSPGGLYVIAIHLSDYKDTTTSSIDHHTASRNTTTVNATITCEPPNPATRTEPVSIRMTVTQQSTAEEGQDHQEGEEVVRYHCWDEEMRTYDRMELWAILSVLQGDQGWFDVVGMFDYEQARSGKVGAPLAWPQLLQTWSGTKDELEVTQAKPDMDWSEWWGVEAVAVVLKRR